MALEPFPSLMLEGDALARGLAAMAYFADLISPYLTGHSTGVAKLAGEAARHCRIDAAGVRDVRWAGLLHDLGRVAVTARIWQKPGPLTADEWEQVRLHPYHTQRVLSRSAFLSGLSPLAGAHHERLDGSGYHRAATGAELGLPARLLAAADAYQAMTEPRPHRGPLSPELAARTLAADASAGRLDPAAVTAVVTVAGQVPPRLERPAGLTERESQVVGMLARGLQTKQVARAPRDIEQDGRPPHPERVPQDRRIDPGRSHCVRDGTWAGRLGRTPDGAAGRRGHSVARTSPPPSAAPAKEDPWSPTREPPCSRSRRRSHPPGSGGEQR